MTPFLARLAWAAYVAILLLGFGGVAFMLFQLLKSNLEWERELKRWRADLKERQEKLKERQKEVGR